MMCYLHISILDCIVHIVCMYVYIYICTVYDIKSLMMHSCLLQGVAICWPTWQRVVWQQYVPQDQAIHWWSRQKGKRDIAAQGRLPETYVSFF